MTAATTTNAAQNRFRSALDDSNSEISQSQYQSDKKAGTRSNSLAIRKLMTFMRLSEDVQNNSNAEQRHSDKSLTFAYIIFFLLGVGMLFPWNVFIVSREYFSSRLNESSFSKTFSNFFTTTFMLSNVMLLTYMQFFNGKPMVRIISALVLNGVVFLLCTVMTLIVNIDQDTFFYVTLFLVFLSGGSTAFLQNGVFGLAATFPPILTQAVMSGQGLAAVAVSVCGIATKLIGVSSNEEPGSISVSTFLYFLFAFLVIGACIISTFYLRRSSLYKSYCSLAEEPETEFSNLNENDALVTNTSSSPSEKPFVVNRWKIFVNVLPMSIAVFLVFFVSLLVYPSTVTLTRPTIDDEKWKSLFVPLIFLNFSIFDWLGKSMPGFPKLGFINFLKPSNALAILALSISRFVFILLFLACNIAESGDKEFPLSGYIKNDILFHFILAVFATTNGWFGSLSMIHGPSLAHGKNDHAEETTESQEKLQQQTQSNDKAQQQQIQMEKQIAGTILVYALTLGLAVGSASSFGMRAIMCDCNPFYD